MWFAAQPTNLLLTPWPAGYLATSLSLPLVALYFLTFLFLAVSEVHDRCQTYFFGSYGLQTDMPCFIFSHTHLEQDAIPATSAYRMNNNKLTARG